MNHERMMPPTAAMEAALSEAPERLTGTAASLQRIQALVLRHLRLPSLLLLGSFAIAQLLH